VANRGPSVESFPSGEQLDKPVDLRHACVEELFALAEEAASLLRRSTAVPAPLLRIEAAATVGAQRLAEARQGDAELAASIATLLSRAAGDLDGAAAATLTERLERAAELLRALSDARA
jgi:hypothetical protein